MDTETKIMDTENKIVDTETKIMDTETETEKVVKKVPFQGKQVNLAVSALLAHLEETKKESKEKDELFENEDLIWLVAAFKKIPLAEKKPRKIALNNPYNTEKDVCLISKEPAKEVKQKLEEQGITTINKVISLTKLRKEYKTFQLKRQLFASHDIFLCDDRIYHFVVKALGKEFFRRKKEPIPIRLTYKNWAQEINKSVNCALLRVGHGPCSAVKVGSVTQQSKKELIENAVQIMTEIGETIPGKWKNIKCLHLKTSCSVALPVYQASPLTDISMDKVVKE